MRLFFSYGHDRNVPIVMALKKALEEEGHEVWVDQFEIKGGDDWRRKITTDILGCDMTVAFASEHSIRRPGVCLDELCIAVSVRGSLIQSILLENVTPPSAIGRRQFIDFSAWSEKMAQGEEVFATWFEDRKNELLAFLESKPVQMYAAEIDELNGLLHPDLSCLKKDLLLAQNYQERPWLNKRVEAWISAPGSRPVLVIQGGPGTGKSLFIAHTYLRYAVSPAVVFCDFAAQNHNTPDSILRSIVFQLASTQDDYRSLLLEALRKSKQEGTLQMRLENTDVLLNELLIGILSPLIDGDRPDTVIIIDGIDEIAPDEQGLNPFLTLLQRTIHRFPRWMRFLLTSRPGLQLRQTFSSMHHIELSCEESCADIRSLVGYTLAQSACAASWQQVAAHCKDNFLLARLICEDLKTGCLKPEDLSGCAGIADLYAGCFARIFNGGRPDRRLLLLLGALAISPAPLPKETLLHADSLFGSLSEQPVHSRLRQEPSSFVQHFLESFDSYLVCENGSVRLFHKSLADWLFSADNLLYGLRKEEAWSMLGALLEYSYSRGVQNMNAYERLFLIDTLQKTESTQTEKILSDQVLAKRLIQDARRAAKTGDSRTVYTLKKAALSICSHSQNARGALELARQLSDLAYRLVLYGDVDFICSTGIQAAKHLNTKTAWHQAGTICHSSAYSLFRRQAYEDADELYVKAWKLFERGGELDQMIEVLRARGENARFLPEVPLDLSTLQNRLEEEWTKPADLPAKTTRPYGMVFEPSMNLFSDLDRDPDEMRPVDAAFLLLEDALWIHAAGTLEPYKARFAPSSGIHIMQTLARLYLSERSDLQKARILLEEAGQWSQTYPHALSEHEIGLLEYAKAQLDFSSKDYHHAKEKLLSSLAHTANADGEDSVNLCDALNLLGSCMLQTDEPHQAAEYFRKSYEIRLQAYGPRHLLTCISQHNRIKAGLGCRQSDHKPLSQKEQSAYDQMFAELLDILDDLRVDSEQAAFHYALVKLTDFNFLVSSGRPSQAEAIADELIDQFVQLKKPYYVVIALKNRACLPTRKPEEKQADIQAALGWIENVLNGIHPLRTALFSMNT